MSPHLNDETIYEILMRIEQKVDKINSRVAKLEIWRGFMTGGMAVIVAVIAWVGSRLK